MGRTSTEKSEWATFLLRPTSDTEDYAGRQGDKPGNLRRLDRIMNQLDLTYDVFGMEPNQLTPLLPRGEFGHRLS